MKLHTLLIVGFAVSMMGCAEKEQAAPEPPVEEAQVPPPTTEATPAGTEEWQTDGLLTHMHRHADRLDDLNIALAEGNLDSAMAPAEWLSRHNEVNGVPSDWQMYLDGMREAALAVREAPDLEAARTAAERITEQCQGCHTTAGIAT
jgi:hypothetical protein